MVLRIRFKQLLHVRQIFLTCLDSLVVALQADIEPVGKEQAAFLCRVRVVTTHAGGLLNDGRVLDCRCLVIFDNFLVTLPAKFGSGSLQNMPLVRHMRRMAIGASGDSGLVPESRIREPRTHICVAAETQLRVCNPQHPGNVPAVRIMACNTGPNGKRPMRKTSLESIFCMALEADGFRCLHQARRPPLHRNHMAKRAHLTFGKQTLHIR